MINLGSLTPVKLKEFIKQNNLNLVYQNKNILNTVCSNNNNTPLIEYILKNDACVDDCIATPRAIAKAYLLYFIKNENKLLIQCVGTNETFTISKKDNKFNLDLLLDFLVVELLQYAF